MRHSSTSIQRVLAIDPYTKGFGFAVLEGPERLIDYGVKKVKGDKNYFCLKKLANLIEHYQPDVIILENPTGKGSRRCQRVQQLLKEVLELAASRRIKVQSFSLSQIRKAFYSSGAFNKYQVASTITKRFPELALRFPQVHKFWVNENERMSIFDAAPLALTLFLKKPNRFS